MANDTNMLRVVVYRMQGDIGADVTDNDKKCVHENGTLVTSLLGCF